MSWLYSGLLGAIAHENAPPPPPTGLELDLSPPLYASLVSDTAVTDLLGTYLGRPSVHTRMPVPVQAEYPMIVVSPDIVVTSEDGLKSRRPVVTRNIRAFGVQNSDYRVIENLGYVLRNKFHRRRDAITVTGHHVIDIVAAGPTEGAGSDNARIERVVSLTVRLLRS